MPIGWMLGAYRFFEWFFKEGEDLLEIRAAMRRLGLDPNDEDPNPEVFRATRGRQVRKALPRQAD
jgi:hypothetical protein